MQRIDWQATLVHPDNRAKLSTLHYHQQRKSTPALNIIALDTSGSTLISEQLSEAKEVVKSLSEHFYQQREMMTLLCFGNQKLEWLIKASKTPYHIDKILASIQAGGGTPLGEALFEIQTYLSKRMTSHPLEKQKVFIITDGRSRDNLEHLQISNSVTTEIHVLDSETSEIKLGKAKQLANTLNANYVNLSELEQKHIAHNKN